MLNLNFVTPKRHFLARNRVIQAIVRWNQFSRFSSRGRKKQEKSKKKREGKVQKVTQALYFTIRGESLCERIFTKFCTSGDMLDIIICANFDVKK